MQEVSQYYQFSSVFNVMPRDMDDIPESGYMSEILTQTDLDTQLCDSTWAKTDIIDSAIDTSEHFGTVYPYYIDYPLIDIEFEIDDYDWELDSDYYPLLTMPSSDTIVGVALNGVFFMTATSSYGYDALFPKAYGKKLTPRALEVDQCLGTPENFNTYGYRTFTPCIYSISTYSEPFSCSSNKACSNDTMQYALAPVPQ